ncbi:MarR family winged helix-turn-helix transcriptional regulator [Brevibacillus dissolubilis]|uniref:MarR family winged helix-turn-helix transcriptional regulator n=1 Tax=Brevibacillus dissolubilis TaxID=1844116 RepID=UPI0011175133|nr:MarR family winged helix-turn-helix transcriptional regulator [Brevibacillus dissolubilis]
MKELPAYVNVREIFQLLVRRFGILQKDGAQCCGISVIQSHVLYELHKRPNLSLNDLAQILSTDTSTLSRQVNSLVELGWVSRLQDPKDRRYVTLALTEEGERQHDIIARQMQEYVESILVRIPEDKRQQVLESLQLISTAMSQSPSCCTPPM